MDSFAWLGTLLETFVVTAVAAFVGVDRAFANEREKRKGDEEGVLIQRIVRAMFVAAAASGIWMVSASHAFASAGDLDRSFNGTGVVTTSFDQYDFGPALALQSDGKIVTAGTAYYDADFLLPPYFALARYDPNGQLDPTFGAAGLVSHTVNPIGSSLNAMAIQADGKIVVAGTTTELVSFRNQFLVIRYNTNGSLDSTFGSGGIVTTNFAPYDANINAVVIQADGYIVVAGQTELGIPNGDDPIYFTLARYAPNGSLDRAFGTNGVATTAFELKASAYALALQQDGKIVAAGYSRKSGISTFSVALSRYTTGGALDTTFGTNGIVIAHPGAITDFLANAVAVQNDGKIITAGQPGFSLIRFTANGTLDISFGQQGIATPNISTISAILSMVLQPDGKIIAAGWEDPGMFTLVRLSKNGQPDQSFGKGGIVDTKIGSVSAADAVALQLDGKIVVAGTGNARGSFALARYLGDPAPPIPTLALWSILALSAMVGGVTLAGARRRLH